MKATIKSITLENFKGAKTATYTFDGKNATIRGRNGAGKTTIADSYFWALADKNYALASNPNIRPIGAEECIPRAEIVFDIDGKEVQVAKIQKCTVKKSKTGGADTISISNTYEANSVECGERDFKKKMEAYGFDFSLFLALSHPDAFTGQKAIEMREILFGMASEKSDKEIADLTEGAEDAAALLADHTAEEVKAMQKATLRKISEVYGKDGEILRAEIRGKESSKTDIDVSELESAKKHLDAQIAENKAKQEDISKEFEWREKIKIEIASLESKINELYREASEENRRKRFEIEEQKTELERKIKTLDSDIMGLEYDIPRLEKYIESLEHLREKELENWNEANSREFDKSDCICDKCGQELPEDKKEEISKNFENKKASDIRLILERGNEIKESILRSKKEMQDSRVSLGIKKTERKTLKLEIKNLDGKINDIPTSVDISDREDVKEIKQQIAEKEESLNHENSADEIRQRLKSEGESLQKQMDAINEQFALVKKNAEIDKQIEDLTRQLREYGQQKCDCDKIIDQLDLISRKKNELLTDEINKNFDVVRWQLFQYRKNGEYESCCIPTIDGKRFGESTNTGREILAKLDIIKGLQRFYGQSYPVFLDNSECLSEETKKCIDMDCQIIYLSVSEDKELRIGVE